MHFSHWTLRSRLIGLIVLLVAVTSLIIGAVMAVVVRESITSQSDSQLKTRAQFLSGNGGAMGAGGGSPLYLEAGTIIAAFVGDEQVGEYCAEGGTQCSEQLQPAQVASFSAVRGGDVVEVTVPRYGEYRATAVPGFINGAGRATFVVAVPQSALNRQIAPVLGAVVVVVLLVILLAGLLGALTVGRALRPLRRVAGSHPTSLPCRSSAVTSRCRSASPTAIRIRTPRSGRWALR